MVYSAVTNGFPFIEDFDVLEEAFRSRRRISLS